jgi:histidine triad (HIT) family protein
VSDPTGGCVFCRIVRDELPATIVHRADGFVAIEDIAPKAPVHVLVLPERHVATFREVGAFEAAESKRMLEFVADAAQAAGLEDYRVIVNVGPQAGQTVFHLHWHVLGGRRLPFP